MSSWNTLFKDKRFHFEKPSRYVVGFYQKYLKQKHGLRILDAGCGMGRHCFYFAEKGHHCYGADIASTALGHARSVVKKRKLKNVKFFQTSMGRLPFDNDYFDVIVSINAMGHGFMRDTKKYFKEMFKVLKKGGFIIIKVPSMRLFRQVRRKDTKKLEKGTYVNLDVPDGKDVHHFFTHTELREIFKSFKIHKLNTGVAKSEWMHGDTYQTILIAQKK